MGFLLNTVENLGLCFELCGQFSKFVLWSEPGLTGSKGAFCFLFLNRQLSHVFVSPLVQCLPVQTAETLQGALPSLLCDLGVVFIIYIYIM